MALTPGLKLVEDEVDFLKPKMLRGRCTAPCVSDYNCSHDQLGISHEFLDEERRVHITSRPGWFEFFFSALVALLLFEETARAKTSLGMVRASSLRFTALEAGREGTKGCLALIFPDGLVEVVLVGVQRPASLPDLSLLAELDVYKLIILQQPEKTRTKYRQPAAATLSSINRAPA